MVAVFPQNMSWGRAPLITPYNMLSYIQTNSNPLPFHSWQIFGSSKENHTVHKAISATDFMKISGSEYSVIK
jgi:hypothetical protein